MNRKQAIQAIFDSFESLRRAAFARSHLEQPKPGLPTFAQVGVMLTLKHTGPLSIKDLAAKFRMTPSAATQLANGLVKEGFVRREGDSKDRRKISLEMTAKGKQTLVKAKKRHLEKMNAVLKALSDTELLQLEKIQRKLVDHMQSLWIKNQPHKQ